MEQVLFIEIGTGVDLHGQDVTVASVRAARDAICRNSLPGLRRILPGGDLGRMKVHVILGVPYRHEEVDIEAVQRVFPYGQVSVEVRQGGLVARSGVTLPEQGDKNDDMVIVNAVVEVGYE
jgi:uncharacterized protein (TIGR02058 family)